MNWLSKAAVLNSGRSHHPPACLAARALTAFAAFAFLLVAGMASTATAQAASPINPYAWQSCVTDNYVNYGTMYYRDCKISPPTDVTPPFYWTNGTVGNVATNGDGSLVFVGGTNEIHVFARDLTTGDMTYQGCVSDRGAGIGNNLPPDCAGLANYYASTKYTGQFAGTSAAWNMAYQGGQGPIRMSVIGNDLYAATQSRLLHFKIVAGSPTTLSFNACWRSVTDPSNYNGSTVDTCQVPQIEGMNSTGHLIFESTNGPVVSPDGKNVYAMVSYYVNILNGLAQPNSHIAAVLNFTRDPLTGTLSYGACNGTVVERDDADIFNPVIINHSCASGGLYSLRVPSSYAAFDITPDGNTLVVAGMGGDTLSGSCPDPGNTSTCRPWAVALFTRGAGGTLANQECIMLPSGRGCPNVPFPYDNVSSGTGNPFNVTFAPSNVAGISDIYLETNQYTTSDPTAFILHSTTGTYGLVSNPVNTADVRLAGSVYDRLFKIAPKNGQLFTINGTGNPFETVLNVFHPDANNQGLLTYLDCTAGAVGQDGYVQPCAQNVYLPENSYMRQMTFTPDGNTMFSMGLFLTGFTQGAPKTLTVNSGNGKVNSTPAGITNCQTTGCTADFEQNLYVTLTALPNTGYQFTSWSGDCSGIFATCTLLMHTAKNVTANFDPIPKYTLTVSSLNGSVSSNPAGISNCQTSNCTADFTQNTNVTLTATPANGYSFSNWTGDCNAASANQCFVTMSAAKNVIANYTQLPTYLLTVNSANGSVSSNPAGINNCQTSNCSASFVQNTNVQLTATPATGYTFSGWTGGDCNGTATNPCSIAMSAAKTVTANFSAIPQFTLTVNSVNGTVTSNPGGINCSTTNCTAQFNQNTSVQLTAAPSAGYKFSGWTGGCTGTTNPCSLNMTAAVTVTASFTVAAPATPTGFNAKVTTAKVGKTIVYTGSLTWTDTTNETGYIIERFKKSGKSCVLDTTFSKTAPLNATSYTDTTANSSVCGYGVAATNAGGTSAFATDFNLTN